MKAKTLGWEKEHLIDGIRSFLGTRDETIFAYIFGSFVEEIESRVIDVAVYALQNNLLAEDGWYEIRLSIELEEKCNVPFDVIRFVSASDHLKYEISKGILLKNGNDDFRIDFISSSWC